MVSPQPWQICSPRLYKANSTYQFNLEMLSFSFTGADDSSRLFDKVSTGASPNTVYGVALCRGDVNTSACSNCVHAAFQGATQQCPLSKDVTIFYNKCLLRFSDKDILIMDSVNRVNTSAVVDGELVLMNITSEPMLPGWEVKNQSANITSLFQTMLDNTIAQVFSKPRHYATIRMDAGDGSTTTISHLYSMAQCAPDMIEDICYNCLTDFSNLAMENFAGRQGGRVLGLRCNLRYGTSKFYDGEPTWSSGLSGAFVPSPSPEPEPLIPSPKHKKSMAKVLVIALTGVLLGLLICVIISLIFRRHNKGKLNAVEDEALILELEGKNTEFTIYDFSQVLEATEF
nr:unnamed protein product [Digitaria exilis]